MLGNWEWGVFFTQEFPAFLGFPEFLEFPVLGTGNAVFFPRIPKIPGTDFFIQEFPRVWEFLVLGMG